MPAPRFIILLAMLAVVLAGWILHWGALSPAPDPAAGAGRPHSSPQPPVRAAPHPECVDDVSVLNNIFIADMNDGLYLLQDPPDYAVDGDNHIRIYYDVENKSCQDVTIAVELRGSKSEARIRNADPPDDPRSDSCTSSTGCVIAAGQDLPWQCALGFQQAPGNQPGSRYRQHRHQRAGRFYRCGFVQRTGWQTLHPPLWAGAGIRLASMKKTMPHTWKRL